MTCDELLDLITGERPDESHECRIAMRGHLSRCRSCRRLADALEPAVELFRDCSAGEERAGSSPSFLSGPWDELHEPEELHAGASQGRSTAWTALLADGDLMRLAAAVLLGLTLGALFWGRGDTASQARDRGPLTIGPVSSSAADPVPSPRVTLASLRLTTACIPAVHRPLQTSSTPSIRPAADLLAVADLGGLACCTNCHASLGMASHSKSATLEVIRSCQACHTF